MAAKALIDGLTTGSNTIQIDNNGDDRQQQNTLSQSSSAIPSSAILPGYVLFSFTFFILFLLALLPFLFALFLLHYLGGFLF